MVIDENTEQHLGQLLLHLGLHSPLCTSLEFTWLEKLHQLYTEHAENQTNFSRRSFQKFL